MKKIYFLSIVLFYSAQLIGMSTAAQARKLRDTVKKLVQGKRFMQARKLLEDSPQLLSAKERTRLLITIESDDIKESQQITADIKKQIAADDPALLLGHTSKTLFDTAKITGPIQEQSTQLTQFFTNLYKAEELKKNGDSPTNFTELTNKLAQLEAQRIKNPQIKEFEALKKETAELQKQYAEHLIGSIVWHLITKGKAARIKLYELTGNNLQFKVEEKASQKPTSNVYRAKLTEYVKDNLIEDKINKLEHINTQLQELQ